ncbi:YbhB/YbcL family Raf kinase inhibitor-like protein [Rhizobium anhuiense]|uniref:YbhB/YbcL family Raf kinase inhibitor-like protein n=1 Tax=Rhizobium anhuiense TaxID=1184720 RepID=UPI001AEC861D|nr:YbhB/YbcL family Raf kinase inhibitor-like protein [Rhizobium anhuiense]
MTENQQFTLSIPDLLNGKFQLEHMLSEPYGFGCAGGNRSPAFVWSNPPEGTKSFVLTIFDKDAPTGFGWVHWVVINIPAEAAGLPPGISSEGTELPAHAVQTRTDFGVPGYGGPCPPPGSEHDYVFTLTALGIESLPEFITADATPALVGFFAKANALGEATFSVRQGR